MYHEHPPVLIVGGSLVGLSAAIFLSAHGVRPVLVERHSGTSPHPRAGGFNFRTMELYRSVGIEEAIRAIPDISSQSTGILKVETLSGREIGWFDAPYLQLRDPDKEAVSPCGWGRCMQDKLEPILKARALELGAELHFGTELLTVEQTGDGVRADIFDRTSGSKRTVQAGFLIAADGPKSPVRQQLGIATQGPGTLSHMLSILFEADLQAVLRGRRFALCHIENPSISGGVFIPQGERSLLALPYFPERGQSAADFTPTRCIELLRAAIGVPDMDVKLHSVLPWELAAQVATRMQAGRVFLAGDAAHVLPPTGAFGANLGIQDAHNLAWKLAYVIKGLAAPALLDTYAAEREPVAELTVQQAVARSIHRFGRLSADDVKVAPIVDDLTVIMGYSYASSAIRAEAVASAEAAPPSQSGRPGTRAPHVVLYSRSSNQQISTLDLFGRHFTLLTAHSGEIWLEAAAKVAERLGVRIHAYRISIDNDLQDTSGRLLSAYGLSAEGAALVRPDGFVGWRTPTCEHADAALEQTLLRLLCRS